jgi:hypothetical protein
MSQIRKLESTARHNAETRHDAEKNGKTQPTVQNLLFKCLDQKTVRTLPSYG